MKALTVNSRPGITLVGTHIDALTQSEVVELIRDRIERGQPIRIGVVNAAKLVRMQSDALLNQDVASSDLVLADGMSVVWASHIRGPALPERVAGIDLMYRLLELADANGFRVYCLGASEEVSSIIASNIARDYPGAVLAGRRNGYFDQDEEASIAREIKQVQPHILLVAMTSPKKENFMARWDREMGVPVVHGVGGSFDVYAGKVDRAPLSWQKLGLEWLYRVKQEPRRLWKRYLATNLLFIWLVIKDLLTHGRLSRQT